MRWQHDKISGKMDISRVPGFGTKFINYTLGCPTLEMRINSFLVVGKIVT